MIYKKFWYKSRLSLIVTIVLWTPLSLILRFTPKLKYEIYGSMNGFQVCDNSNFLFKNSNSNVCFFITKNRELVSRKNKIIFAYSSFGLFLQMFARKAYWSHGMNDFLAPLVCGSYIVGLQHGLPGKTGPGVKSKKHQILKYKVKRALTPYLLNYYCDEIWSPDKKYDKCMRSVFEPMKPSIKRLQIPRIFFQKHLKNEKKILYAPSHRNEKEILPFLLECGLLTNSFLKLLRKNDYEFYFRPHPLTYEAINTAGIQLPEEIILDRSNDIHDSLASFELVITDFSGLIIDCWEMNMETACVCPDLEYIYSNQLLFKWFYKKLNANRFENLLDAVSAKLGHNLIKDT